ncbi:MAG: hypothetical protein ACPGDB_05335 [Fusobacterium sp.]
MKESFVLKAIQSSAPLFKCILFRNNVGMFQIFEKGKKRVVRTGLGKGSSDLIGYTRRQVTPDMVGKTIAIFTAIEVKKGDWKQGKKFNEHENTQKLFLDKVVEDGGIADFSSSIEEFINIVS